MTKRRLYKMTPLQRDILAKVLVETQKEFPPEQAEKMQVLRERTRQAHKCRLYLDNEELDYAVRAVNSVRSGFLAAGKAVLQESHPRSSWRSSAEFRLALLEELTAQALQQAAAVAKEA